MKTPAALSRLWRFTVCPRLGFASPEPGIIAQRRIGLCLSSGGARALAHVGVIQVLEENGIHIAAIAGSSMGAYVGSLWAAGFDGTALEGLAREVSDRKKWYRLLDPVVPPTAGLIRGNKLRQHLRRSLGDVTFADLRIPMMIVATELETRSPHVFKTGDVAAAVHASGAIPGVCAPVVLEGRAYTDGGTSEPLPVSLMRQHFDLDAVIAVNLVPSEKEMRGLSEIKPQPRTWMQRWLWDRINLLASGNVLDTFQRALLSAQIHIAELESARADIVLHPRCATAAWNDFLHYDQHIAAGREAALAALPEILALTRNTQHSKGGGYYETTESHAKVGLIRA